MAVAVAVAVSMAVAVAVALAVVHEIQKASRLGPLDRARQEQVRTPKTRI
jgi:hypothetical protein